MNLIECLLGTVFADKLFERSHLLFDLVNDHNALVRYLRRQAGGEFGLIEL